MADNKPEPKTPALDDLEARRSGQDDPKDDPKPKGKTPDKHADPAPEDATVEHVEIPDEQLPQDIGPRGDAEPAVEVHEGAASGQPKIVDPLLHPDSQQPFESGEDYRRRVPQPPRPRGSFDQSIGRGEEPV
jgi:hypothetical protein